MAMDGEKRSLRRWLQFSLRGLLVLMLLAAIGARLYVQWRLMPFVSSRRLYPNGSPAWEQWRQRDDWRGASHLLKTVYYYSNGQRAYEFGPDLELWWRPDGSSSKRDEGWFLIDKGDGTFLGSRFDESREP